MSNEELNKILKIFKRTCKEEGIFGNHEWYRNHEKFIEETKNPIYYGLVKNMFFNNYDDPAVVAKQYKIQLMFLKNLLDSSLVCKKMHQKCILDICDRYDTSNVPKFEDDKRIYYLWKKVEKLSSKHEIRNYFIKKYEELYGEKPQLECKITYLPDSWES